MVMACLGLIGMVVLLFLTIIVPLLKVHLIHSFIPADLAAHSGSNFLMIYGSIDGYNAPVLDFKDGKAHTMKGLWITNGTYFLNVMANGNESCAKAKSSTQISVVFEGFKADGTTSTGTVKYTVQDGTNSLKSWQYVDLSSLGEISSLKVNYRGFRRYEGEVWL